MIIVIICVHLHIWSRHDRLYKHTKPLSNYHYIYIFRNHSTFVALFIAVTRTFTSKRIEHKALYIKIKKKSHFLSFKNVLLRNTKQLKRSNYHNITVHVTATLEILNYDWELCLLQSWKQLLYFACLWLSWSGGKALSLVPFEHSRTYWARTFARPRDYEGLRRTVGNTNVYQSLGWQLFSPTNRICLEKVLWICPWSLSCSRSCRICSVLLRDDLFSCNVNKNNFINLEHK